MQKEILTKLVERSIRYPYPRYSLRLYPMGLKGVIKNRQELFKFVVLSKDAFVRLFSDYQIAEREYDAIYLDIDDTDLRMAMVKLNVVLERLHNAGIFNYLINFSGKKGFHIYIWFEPTRLMQYRKVVIAWLAKIKVLEFIDTQAVEPSRNMRLPSTMNTKSGFYCVTLGNKLMHTYKDIIDRSINNRLVDFDIIPNPDLGKTLLNIDGNLTLEPSAVKHSTQKSHPTDSIMFKDINDFPPCQRRLVMLALDGVDLNHIERMQMGIFLLHVHGNDVAIVAKYYSKMSDYDYDVTSYQLRYMLETNQHMQTCKHLDDQAICCERRDICAFSPSMNSIMRKDTLLKLGGKRA